MIEKTQDNILQLEDFFIGVQNFLVEQKSWICYIECKLEPGMAKSKTYICLFGENGTDNKISSGQKELNTCIKNIDLKTQETVINLLGLNILSSVDNPKKISIPVDQDFEKFLTKHKPLLLKDYTIILRKRNLEELLTVKPAETKQTKI
jgi:hypothetical protein